MPLFICGGMFGGMAPLFMKTPCGFAQGIMPGLSGSLGGMACDCCWAAFRRRAIINASTRPASTIVSKPTIPATSNNGFDEPDELLEPKLPLLLFLEVDPGAGV